MNVCAAVMPPRPTKPEIKPLDAQQIKVLLKVAEDTDLYALWVLMATTGVRVGEALGLRWDDLNLDARTLRINRTIYRARGANPKPPAVDAQSGSLSWLSKRSGSILKLANGCSLPAKAPPSTSTTCVTGRGSGYLSARVFLPPRAYTISDIAPPRCFCLAVCRSKS